MTFDLPVRRPVAAAMVFTGLVILGVIAWRKMPVELIPPLAGDTLFVNFTRPGSEPEAVERELLAPLEARVATLPGIRETMAEIRGSSGSLTVKLAKGAKVKIRELESRQIAADLVRGQPRGSQIDVGTSDFETFSQFVLLVQVTGGEDENMLRDLVEEQIAPRLRSVSGVSQVQTGGGAPREARIELDPDRCAALGVRPEAVVQAIAAAVSRLQYVGGAEGPGGRTAVVLDARPRGPSSLAEIAVAGTRGIRLGHVADVSVGVGRRDVLFRVNGKPAVGLVVFQEQGVNLVRLGRELRARLAAVKREFHPYGLDFVSGFDAAEMVEKQIDRLRGLALSGFVIAILVLILFLRQPRAVLVVAVAAPVSLLTALAVLFLLGQSVNLITLFGLAVANLLLIDNSIVVYEAAQRRLERGATLDRAATEAVRRTLRAIVAATLTNVIVFAPLLFIDFEDATTTELIKVLALAYIVPLLASLVVAVGLVPLLARRLAAPAAARRIAALRRRRGEFAGLTPPDRVRELASGLLTVALRHPAGWLAGVAAAVLFTAVVALPWIAIGAAGRAPREAESVRLQVDLPGSATLDRTVGAFERLERAARALSGVETVESFIREDGGSLTVHLAPAERRPKDASVDRVSEAVRRAARGVEGLAVRTQQDSGGGEGGGDDVARLFGQAPAQVVLSGPDAAQLSQLADDVTARLQSIPEVGEVFTSGRKGSEEVHVVTDPAALVGLGLTADQVLPALGVVRREGVVLQTGVTLSDEREIPLTVRRAGKGKTRIRDLARLPLTTPSGVVPLDALASVRRMPPPSRIQRHNGRREITLNYRLGSSAPESGPARKALEDQLQTALREVPRPAGYALEPKSQEEAVNWFRRIVAPAVLLVFIVLAVTFESLTMPALVLFALPLTLIGAAWALVLSGMPADVFAMVGAVALLGLTVNPAILLVDRMQERVRRGASSGAAALAAVRERARPVLMTSATAVAGLWPLALSTGRENEIWPPFATVVMGGLIASTLLTLLVTPVGFVLLRKLDVLFGRVGPWVVLGWATATTASMAALIGFGVVTALTWQVITGLLVGGLLLGAAALLFWRDRPPTPETAEGGPPALEVRFLHKIYGQPGPIGYAWRLPDLFARRVLERGGRPFDPRRALERLAPELLLLGSALYLASFVSSGFWKLVFVFAAAVLAGMTLRDLRRGRGRADEFGRVDPGGVEGTLSVCAPWVAWAWVVLHYFAVPHLAAEWRPAGAGGWLLFLIGPATLALVIAVLQSGRRTALRLARGQLAESLAEGRWRRGRTAWRRFSRRVCGLDLPTREVRALLGAEFRVERGMVGVLGPNGAGKTTLLRQIAGILEPSRGTITLGGVPIARLRKRLAQYVGYLPQDFGLPKDLTAREYLEFYALLYEIRPATLRQERIASLLREVGLADRADERIGSYSGGMRQRVAVARTLLRLPPVIVVDEPTVGLDPRERIRFRNLLARLAEGRIVLFSTHVVEDVAVSCDRVIVFAEGRTLYDGAPTQLADLAHGQTWTVTLAPGEAPSWPPGALVVDQTPELDGSMRHRVICATAPHGAATPSEPTLEDGYLLLVRRGRHHQEGQAA